MWFHILNSSRNHFPSFFMGVVSKGELDKTEVRPPAAAARHRSKLCWHRPLFGEDDLVRYYYREATDTILGGTETFST